MTALVLVPVLSTGCAAERDPGEPGPGIDPDATDDGGDGGPDGGEGDDGATDDTGGEGPDGDGGGDEPRLDVGGWDTEGGGPGDDSGECPCAPKLDLIYVLGDPAELWSFDPQTNQFERLGPLRCHTTDTFSMAISRDGHAWVDFGDAQLRTVPLADLSQCIDVGFTPTKSPLVGGAGWGTMGMAFVSHSEADPCDDLYVHDFDVMQVGAQGTDLVKLGRFDVAAATVEEIGRVDFGGAELTGTGEGRLFAFQGAAQPARFIEYDKNTGDTLGVQELQGMGGSGAFAFAFWGGDVYFFSAPSGQVSTVHKLDFDESEGAGQSLTTVVQQAPTRIVGAGVSTCAPFRPPG